MQYQKGPIVGRGSSATVSVATTVSGDLIAVKSTDVSTSEFLQKEQHFLSKLSSKHIIKYMGFDFSCSDNKPMFNLLMEYAPGGSISDFIKKSGGSLDHTVIRSYTHQILLGLEYLHGNNLVHCDIKCGNLLICDDGVKIADFGCAKTAKNTIKTTTTTTTTMKTRKACEFSGTPAFMSPEVARGEEQGFPADVWAVGCSVIEMATGCNPWSEMKDPVSCLYRIGYSGESPEIPICLPEDCKDFLNKCLKKDVNERWTVKELLQHPFVSDLNHLNDLNSSSETRNSPTSVLDQGFWECLPAFEGSPEVTEMGGFSGESPAERMRRLVEGGDSSLIDWDKEDEWIAVRRDRM